MAIDTTVASEVEEWKADLDSLYDQLVAWLGEMDIQPEVVRRPIRLNEQVSGPYEVDELVFTNQGPLHEGAAGCTLGAGSRWPC